MSTIPEPPKLPTPSTPGAIAVLRERCSAMGMPTWRCDRIGKIIADPIETGPTGLWLRSTPIAGEVSKIAAAWARQKQPEVTQIADGIWAIPFAERRRRERTGLIIALAMSPASLASPIFDTACNAAQIDPQATRRSLSPKANFDEAAATRQQNNIAWMAADLEQIERHDTTVAGFTRQLTNCFETIDLLYGLGRSMGDLTRPDNFLEDLVGCLHRTMAFGWLGAWVSPDAHLPLDFCDRVFGTGAVPLTGTHLSRLSLNTQMLVSDPGSRILTKIEGVKLGPCDQVVVQPITIGGQSCGYLVAGDKRGDDPQVSSYDLHLLEAAAGYVGAFLDNASLYAAQKATFLGTLEALTAAIDAKDRYTCGHSDRVAHLSWQLALAIGMKQEDADRVRIAGIVHDVGKIGVPEAVLTKQGRLTDDEFEAIKKHPEIGHRILRDIPQMADVLPGVLHHHEKWDGRGYPHGLIGERIPLMARIIALADTFDAMSSTRSYRQAMPREKVLEEIRKCAGTQFDPALVGPFLSLDFGEYDALSQQAASVAIKAAEIINKKAA